MNSKPKVYYFKDSKGVRMCLDTYKSLLLYQSAYQDDPSFNIYRDRAQQDFEILVVDNPSTDPEFLALLLKYKCSVV